MPENKNTGFKRANSIFLDGFVGDITATGESNSSSPTEDSILVLFDFNYTVPNGATIEGIEVQSKVLNEGSGSTPEYGNLVARAQVGYGGVYGTTNDVTLGDNTLTSLDFGGSTSLEGKTWTSTQANNLQLKFTYQSDDSGFDENQTLTISGSSTNLLPAVKIYYSHTDDISYTRQQLRGGGVNSTEVFDSNDVVQFSLNNNSKSTAYFVIEGGRYMKDGQLVYKDIFNSSSLSNLSNCTVVSSSVHAAFIVEPNVTATFNFNPTHDILGNEIKFKAPNTQVTNPNGTNFYGVDLGISSVT